MKRFSLLIIGFFCMVMLYGQIPDSPSTDAPVDTAAIISPTIPLPKKEKKRFLKNLFDFKKDYPSAKKALLLSAILPGAGQVYTKKYWKLPVVYGALGAMGYFISFNTRQYKRFRTAYIYRLDEDPCTIDEFADDLGECTSGNERLTAESIRTIRNGYQKNKELSYIGFVIAYILVGVDAFVDAHLLSFDVNDDLSLQIMPQYEGLPNQSGAVGLHFSFQPKPKDSFVLPVTF